MNLRPKVGCALVCLIVLQGCGPVPQHFELVPGAAIPPRHELQIWRDRKELTLHGVHLADSTLTGVPLHRPPECDSCAVQIPLAEIDSVRRVRTEQSWMILAALPAVALLALAGASALNTGLE